MSEIKSLQIKIPYVTEKKHLYDYLAPDTSEITRLTNNEHANRGDMAHCSLPGGKVSIATKHKSVEELWYFIEGHGEIWLSNNDIESVHTVKKGTAIYIPPGISFQFRNLNHEQPLEIIITTMPPWPGSDEAIQVEGKWQPTPQK